MGWFIDDVVGPLLETFGVIAIGPDGEWARREDTANDGYRKEEREDRKSLWSRISEWFKRLMVRIKLWRAERLNNRVKVKSEKLRKDIDDATKMLVERNQMLYKPEAKPQKTEEKKLRKISKFEGKALLSSGKYKIWYDTRYPYDEEITDNVVYIIPGTGKEITDRGYLSGIREDGYYVMDKIG